MKLLKKFLATFGAAAVLFTGAPVDAKIVADKLPLLTYAETPVATYDAPDGNKKGTIAAGSSLVLVKIIRPDGWAYGSYKVGNKKKRPYRWFKMSDLQGYADFENYTDKATSDQDAYRTRSSMSLVGKISGDENLIVVAKRGDKCKVIFKADGNFYRMGWVSKIYLAKTAANDTSGNGNSSDDLLTGTSDDLLTSTSTDDTLTSETENIDGTDELDLVEDEDGDADFDANEIDTSFEETEFTEDTPEPSNEPSELNVTDELPPPVDEPQELTPAEIPQPTEELPPPVDEPQEITPVEIPQPADELPPTVDEPQEITPVEPSDELLPPNDSLPAENITTRTIGDVNGNGTIDAVDIALLQKYLDDNSTQINLDNADVNGDGVISMFDVNVLLNLIKAAGKGTGDVNGDGKIDLYDVQALSAYLAKQTVMLNRINADLNGDGTIDDADFQILLAVIAILK